ncbi:MAG: hypothetical protein RLZZ297_1899 [Chloroflexota bacterium]|jgi:membrane protein YdbS with pleckstrin-like domain
MAGKSSIIDEKETVYGVYRPHTMTVYGAVSTELLFLALTAVAAYFAQVVFVQYQISVIWQQWAVYGALIVLALILVVRMVRDYLNWYYTQVIVTNRRLIRREGILSRRVSDIALTQLSEVVITQSLLGRLFNYGDVHVTGDSDASKLQFVQVKNPFKLRTVIDDARVGARSESKGTTAPIATEEDKTPTNPLTIVPSGTAELGLEPGSELEQTMQHIDALERRGVLTAAEAAAKRAQLTGQGT